MLKSVKAVAKKNLYLKGLYLKSLCLKRDGPTMSLPQHGFDMCKPAFSKKKLQAQFHEIKDENFWRILPEVYDFTQLTMEPLWSLYEAVRYIVSKDIKGDIVECGVLFGGSAMLITKTLLALNDASREIWLYDSFEGFVGQQAPDDETWYGDSVKGTIPRFDTIAAANLESVGYPQKRIKFVKGDIEKTAPANQNHEIALLRLDTDTYHSTKAELEHFYPKLVRGGVLIIDDYGHAFGARRATDEYFADPSRRVLLHRVNFTNRIGVKAEHRLQNG
jgi:O-methyltransferase